MKPGFFIFRWCILIIVPTVTFLGLPIFSSPAVEVPDAAPPEYQPASGEFAPIGQAVLKLFESKDAAGFAREISVSGDDWHSLITTNLSSDDVDKLNSFAKGASYERLKGSATAALSRADSLHIDFSKGNWRFQITTPKHTGRIYYSGPAAGGGLSNPYLEKLEVVLVPATSTGAATNGDFKLTLRGVEKFPAGWRINEGIQWTAFPNNIVDAKTAQELAMLDKVASRTAITGEDAPALLKLGDALVRFVRARNTNSYQKELLLSSDMVWDMFQKSGMPGPSRKEIDDEINQLTVEQLQVAQAMVQLMENAGIDLKDADIKIISATLASGQSPRGAGTLDNLMGTQFKLALSVSSAGHAKNGAALSGDYVLAVKQLTRFEGNWKIEQDVHWEKLPDGVVDAKTSASMEFENYVAQYGTLPRGTVAPEIEFTTLDGGKNMKLSDLRGKVVILDFWATWCGPCQQPMAELQKLRQNHADWQDQVAIVPLSIDDTMGIVSKHIAQRGWTNTFNVWAGDGGWHSLPAQTFRVTGVPTSYVIDQKGTIVWAGHPAGANFGETVDALLKNK